MLGLLGLLGNPVGLAAGGVALVAVAGGAWFVVHQHDARIRAEMLATQREQQIVEFQAAHARTVAALEAEAMAAREAAERNTNTKAAIYAAPPTTGCADRPAVRAALDGLRRRDPAQPDQAAGRPGVSDRLPAPTGTAGGKRQ